MGISPFTPELTESNRDAYFEEYVPIRFAGALNEKLKKRYWEKEHVAGHPLILAVQDFHAPGSMVWTGESLPEYLYGLRYVERNGEIVPERIAQHQWEAKSVPSNFFAQPNTEHISAVIANPGGTLAKFKRMGYLTGFGHRHLRIIRSGFAYQGQPVPTPFKVEVTAEGYQESWCEGLAVYHNPNANTPVPPEALPGAGHFTVEDGWLMSMLPPFFPMGSQTLTLVPTDASGQPTTSD